MIPQVWLNYRMKSVAHLPWRVLGYRFVNTFIDDVFAFIVKMPTMARIAVFRDDIVFIVYLYQRWAYPVDRSRPAESIDGEEESVAEETGAAATPPPAAAATDASDAVAGKWPAAGPAGALAASDDVGGKATLNAGGKDALAAKQ